ncbi:virulence RhuM family protein [Sulfurimonas crateris]|uniref:Virulence RhuM family protein n=1 Tax=Sulfurimonas crateris TaxID=2574727 RepID=A0A4U2ZBB7_9BACT|nr:virulence RhuM family protein [Sulfurimonas crateris]TKI70962.1 virulence RhuM family protein [Sulfurimonas crateris]
MNQNKTLTTQDELTEFLLYTTPNSEVKVEIFVNNETVWLPQKRMAELFGVNVPAISKHLNNIYEDGELDKEATISILETVQKEGNRSVKREVEYYNLDAILSVGYRVNSSQATQFRIWATKVLKEYIIKGFAMDDERLKNGRYFGKDYFKELLERVRSIRASERRIYQQITDIFAECSIDYNSKSETTKNFYATIQNKFHFAISGQTAAEIIYQNADKTKPFMGLQTFKNSPDGRVLKSDTTVAKNYLSEEEIKKLERAVSGYFDYIERLIENKTALTMEQLADSVNKFLEFNEYQVLQNSGKVSKTEAELKAFAEYDEFNKTQKIESDFDREIKKILGEYQV